MVGWKVQGGRNVEGSRFTWLKLDGTRRSQTLTLRASVENAW